MAFATGFSYGPAVKKDTCRACGQPIIWGRFPPREARGSASHVPLDPEPVPSGNVVLARTGYLAHRVEPGETVPPVLEARRFRDHRGVCKAGPRHTWKLEAALDTTLGGVPRVPANAEAVERVRQIKLELEGLSHP